MSGPYTADPAAKFFYLSGAEKNLLREPLPLNSFSVLSHELQACFTLSDLLTPFELVDDRHGNE